MAPRAAAPPAKPVKGRLTVTEVSVKGFLGIRSGAIEPGRVTLIQGRNGSMKTSFLQAIQMGLGGGNLARLAHVGAEGEEADPEVVIVLKGDREYRVEKKGDKTARVLARVGNTQAFEDLEKPQAWLSSLFDARGCNIVQLLKAPDKDLATLILEALPLELDRPAFVGILGDFEKYVRAIPVGLHALEELGMARADIFAARTGVNRDKDGATKTARELRQSLPSVMPETHEAGIRTLRTNRDAVAKDVAQAEERAASDETAALAEAEHAAEVEGQKIATEFKTFAAKRRTELATEIGRIDRELMEKIAELRAAATSKTVDLQAAADTEIEAKRTEGEATMATADQALLVAQDAARMARATADAGLRKKREQLRELDARLTTMEAERDQAQRAAGLADHLKSVQKKGEELKAESDRMTATLEALDVFRLRLAKSLPVPGLEISGQEVKVNGVPWAQLNKGQRVSILVKVAVLRAQGMPLPLIFVDDAETLDSEHLTLLEQELEASDVQALISRVGDMDLQVVADGAAAPVQAR